MNLVQRLVGKGLIETPPWMPTNISYLTVMGSHAYGVADTSAKEKSPDVDIYGFAIPPKDMIFPPDHIIGFGPKPPSFSKWTKDGIKESDYNGGVGREWDIQIFGIVDYFELCRQNNPNIIDSLFTPWNAVNFSSTVGRMVRDERKLFLSKLCWKKFRGYAHSQLHKLNDKNFCGAPFVKKIREFEETHGLERHIKLSDVDKEINRRNIDGGNTIPELSNLKYMELMEYQRIFEDGIKSSRRFEYYKYHGYDTKFAYHLVRLLDEAEQIILDGDLNLERAKETLKSIRRGEWDIEDVRKFAMEKDAALEVAYTQCKLPSQPPIKPIKELLLKCLEEHYGSLAQFSKTGWAEETLKDIDQVLSGIRGQLYK